MNITAVSNNVAVMICFSFFWILMFMIIMMNFQEITLCANAFNVD